MNLEPFFTFLAWFFGVCAAIRILVLIFADFSPYEEVFIPQAMLKALGLLSVCVAWILTR